jgi:dienelactone hydrolase
MDLDAKVVLDKENNVAGLFFVPSTNKSVYNLPSYAKPDSFLEVDVTVGSDEWKLPGTLTLPKGNGAFPAVILIHGSGPQDRDESIGPNKPFKDIAIGLASNGIAVLRYEKRTKEYQQKMPKINTSITLKEEVTDDVLSASELLRKTEKIDQNRIFLLGHSLGGMLIPALGMLDKNTAGLIVMAGSTRPLEDLIVDQTKYIFSLNNEMSDKEKEAQMTILLKQVGRIRQKDYNINTPGSELPLCIPPAYWQDLQKYNAGETAKSLKQPLLVLQGERDYQVKKIDFDGWKSCLKVKNVKYMLYPKLNHLFMEGQGKCTPQEYFIESHVADYVIYDIAAWINSLK